MIHHFHSFVISHFFAHRTIFFGHLFLVAIGTIMELFIKGIESNEGMLGILICFSLIENTRTLFRISRSKHHESTGEKTQFKFIHGLRVLSIYWVVLAHVLLFHPFTQYDDLVPPVHSLNTRFSIIQNVFAHFVVNAGLAVETFFFISGTLTVYTILTTTAERSNQSINIFTYIWLRWIRYDDHILIGLDHIMELHFNFSSKFHTTIIGRNMSFTFMATYWSRSIIPFGLYWIHY